MSVMTTAKVKVTRADGTYAYHSVPMAWEREGPTTFYLEWLPPLGHGDTITFPGQTILKDPPPTADPT